MSTTALHFTAIQKVKKGIKSHILFKPFIAVGLLIFNVIPGVKNKTQFHVNLCQNDQQSKQFKIILSRLKNYFLILYFLFPFIKFLGSVITIFVHQLMSLFRGVDPSSEFFIMIWWCVSCTCTLVQEYTHRGCLRGCASLRSWKILYFCDWNHAIWWILLGANLEQAMSKKTQLFGLDWPKFCILGEICDKIFARINKNQPFLKQNLLILTEYL